SDHRMVLALAPQQTILWDQIRYTGDPSEFAWVLPVRPGTTVEISHDEWIAALDATTQPTIIQPQSQPLGGFGGGFGDDSYGGGGGCACGAMSSASALDSASAGPQNVDGGAAPPPPVQVVRQEVVGPYETVIVRSDKPKALEQWLQDHGYAVPDTMLPIITAYTALKLDFVALRLRPGQGVRSMRPVRIVSPGADPTLPLRMVAAGIGSHVGLTLYVLSEGRYRPQNFPEAQLDEKKLFWDASQSRSNYQELSASVMAQGGQRTWLTESAGKPVTSGSGSPSPDGTLYGAYYGACTGRDRVAPTPTEDAGIDAAADAGDPDAGDLDAGGADAGDPDAGAPADDGGTTTDDAGTLHVPSSVCRSPEDLCCEFDDLEAVLNSMHRSDVWLTRLRADLPANALDTDLVLEAHPSQTTVSNVHNALLPSTTGTTARVAPARNTRLGTGLALFGTALLVGRMVRSRRRRS
ncbi:MAG TPA: DUF2330 domain-containing protein, partial [Labilithrix sp.]|nr:DUF2330 domain-containing protein [Labilithrix sp.]